MQKTIIFDLGGVLVEDHIDETCEQRFGTEIADRLHTAFREHGVWKELDKGTISLQDAIHQFYQSEPGLKQEIIWAITHCGSCIEKYEYTDRWLRMLQMNGARVLYLSNWAEFLHISAKNALDFIPKMDGGLFSFETGHVKPEPEIFECLIKKYDLMPEECIFIDDRKKNTDVAERLGMHAILFKNYKQANTEVLNHI